MEPRNSEGIYSLLYVEDDPMARDMINQAISLKFRNVRLFSAENGAIGLELYKEHRPDIVLTDIKMPVMDGLTMAAEIRELQPEAIITVVSAYSDTDQFQARADEIGFNHCIRKPVDYRNLFATIEECIAELRPATQHPA